MIKNCLIMMLLIGFCLQLILIGAMFKLYSRIEKSHSEIFTGLLACMKTVERLATNDK